MKNDYLFPPFWLFLLVAGVLAACSDDSAWRNDPAVLAVREACKSPSGLNYDCIERQAVTTLNPDICHLTGIWIDDMCLQAVYEAANDPTICDRIYLPGVVPNCMEYYAHFTPASAAQTGTFVIPTQTPLPSPTFTPSPTATSTNIPAPTPSSIPLFELDQSGYDPDLFQPIDISHNPPMLARAGDTVRLAFDLVNTIYCADLQRYCQIDSALSYTYGETEEFQAISLVREYVDGMEPLVVRLPATDQSGRTLRYYAEFTVSEAGYSLRYPAAGTIDLFATSNFITIELPTENAVQPGDKVYDFFWGYGPDKVRQAIYENYPQRVGPPAMDVADDGRIALLDPVNERILVFNPNDGSFASYPLPFKYGFYADLAFDPEGKLMACDYQGEEVEETIGPDPYCYLLLPDGKLGASTQVYVRSPSKITRDLRILDYFDSKLVVPFDPQGQANSREVQRQKETWQLPFRYVEGKDPYVARYADMNVGLAFEVHSISPLGVLTDFEKTPQGYVLIFSLGDHIRAVWIDSSGVILKDVSLPNSLHSEINFSGQSAVAPDGSLYIMSSTERGIEIHYAVAPMN